MISVKQAWHHLASKFKLRRMIAPAMAMALALSLVTYESVKPAAARAAATEPSSAPLDDNSVSALLSLDRAMETLAARVTPAIVNVTVTSKTKAQTAEA